MPGPSINDVNSFSDFLYPPLGFPVRSVDTVIMVLHLNSEIAELLFPYFMHKISYFHRINLEIIKSMLMLYYHAENSLKLTTTTAYVIYGWSHRKKRLQSFHFSIATDKMAPV